VFYALPLSVKIAILTMAKHGAILDIIATPRMTKIVFNARSRIAKIVIHLMFARFVRKDFTATPMMEEKLVFNATP